MLFVVQDMDKARSSFIAAVAALRDSNAVDANVDKAYELLDKVRCSPWHYAEQRAFLHGSLLADGLAEQEWTRARVCE